MRGTLNFNEKSSAFFAAQIIIRLSFFKAFSQLCEGPCQ